MKNDIVFLGGITTDTNHMWLNNGKKLSRNYRQGNRVYSSDGIATTLTSQPIGSLGGYTSLYLVINKRSDNSK